MSIFRKKQRTIIIEGATFWSDGKIAVEGLHEVIIRECRFKKGAKIEAGGAKVELGPKTWIEPNQVSGEWKSHESKGEDTKWCSGPCGDCPEIERRNCKSPYRMPDNPIEIKPLPGTTSYREVGSKKNEEGT